MVLKINQLRFCEEFVIDGNATAAYKRAGYKAKGHAAENGAARLMRNDEVLAYIAQLQAKQTEESKITAEWWEEQCLSIFNQCMQEVPVLDPAGEPTGVFRFNATGALRALDMLARKKGLYREQPSQPEFTIEDVQNARRAMAVVVERTIDEYGVDATRKKFLDPTDHKYDDQVN